MRQPKNSTILTLKSKDAVIRMHQTGLITVQKRGFRSKSYLNRQAERQMKADNTIVNLLGLSNFKVLLYKIHIILCTYVCMEAY